MMRKVTVLGAGSWGTTLAVHLAKKGHQVKLWEFFKNLADQLAIERENKRYLPGIRFPEGLTVEMDLNRAVSDVSLIVLAIPSQHARDILQAMPKISWDKTTIVSVSKGIENGTLKRMTEVIADVCPEAEKHSQLAVLTGPSHAEEVSVGKPTTLVAAARDQEKAEMIQDSFITETLRVYTNDDVIGAELGGSLKNIIAIAAGISDGLEFGDNAKAALLTRGLAEISRLGVRMGAKPLTFAGLTGMGDLIVTCTSRHSRNRKLGELLVSRPSIETCLEEIGMVAEGLKTTRSAHELAGKLGVDMPITRAVYQVLFEGKKPLDTVSELMLRDPKPEIMEVADSD